MSPIVSPIHCRQGLSPTILAGAGVATPWLRRARQLPFPAGRFLKLLREIALARRGSARNFARHPRPLAGRVLAGPMITAHKAALLAARPHLVEMGFANSNPVEHTGS